MLPTSTKYVVLLNLLCYWL